MTHRPTCAPTAAVIIPHYNDVERLERCLAALTPQLTPDIEVVVVDNGSDNDPAALVARFPGVRLLRETAKGAAPARNRGVAETTAPHLWFLDCDCLPAPNWIATAGAACTRAPLVGGCLEVFDETPPPRSGAEGFEAVFAFDNRRYIERKGFSVTANLLTRREVFDTVGGFRAGLSEDLDWCRRAGAAGFAIVYAPDLRVGHPSRGDWPALARKWRRLTDEAWGLKPGTRLVWALRALAMPPSAMAHLPKVLFSRRLGGLRERLKTAATLFRLRFCRAVWMLAQALGRL